MTTRVIEFWFEFASTYSYPAAMRIEALAAQYRCTILWKPFLLGPIFAAQGWRDSPFNLYPSKGRYMWRDLERICTELGLPLRKPSAFPRNGLLAARVACVADGASWLPTFVRNVYSANFARDLDIAQPEVVRGCLEGLVADPDAALATATSDAAKAQLRANSDRAMQLGIFGAPSLVVGEELCWGNDRLEAALRWAVALGAAAD